MPGEGMGPPVDQGEGLLLPQERKKKKEKKKKKKQKKQTIKKEQKKTNKKTKIRETRRPKEEDTESTGSKPACNRKHCGSKPACTRKNRVFSPSRRLWEAGPVGPMGKARGRPRRLLRSPRIARGGVPLRAL